MQHGAGIKHDPAGVKHEAGGVKYEASGAKSEAGGLRCDPDGVKRETAGVKREREAGGAGGDDDHVPRSASSNRVDLTEQVRGWLTWMLVVPNTLCLAGMLDAAACNKRCVCLLGVDSLPVAVASNELATVC
jgi:hypothetical protein